jgi:chondroitin 4-sulfotransferase 11
MKIKKLAYMIFFYSNRRRFNVNSPENHIGEFYHFTFVRNPFDRVVSSYFSKIKAGSGKHGSKVNKFGIPKFIQSIDTRLKKGDVSFEDFVSILSENKRLYTEKHFRPQSRFLTPKCWDNMSFIGRYENLQLDWDLICRENNLTTVALPYKNKSVGRTHYREYYNDHTRSVISSLYKEDFDRFGYTF